MLELGNITNRSCCSFSHNVTNLATLRVDNENRISCVALVLQNRVTSSHMENGVPNSRDKYIRSIPTGRANTRAFRPRRIRAPFVYKNCRHGIHVPSGTFHVWLTDDRAADLRRLRRVPYLRAKRLMPALSALV